MKRNLVILLLLIAPIEMLQANVKVVASTSDLANLARIIGGDKVDVDHIVRGPQNPHYIEVKPSYMLKLKNADLFLVVGMQLEPWAPQIIDGSRNAALKVIDCSRDISKLEISTTKVDASAGDVHPYGNPHYWLDPENAQIIATEICGSYSEIDPGNAAYYTKNLEAFSSLINTKLAGWIEAMLTLKGKKMVTYHSSFSYFAARFGLLVAAYVEPKPGIPPTPTHTVDLIHQMRGQDIKVIGLEQYFEENIPNQIARATGAKVVPLSTSVGGREGTDSYVALIDYNVTQLLRAFSAD